MYEYVYMCVYKNQQIRQFLKLNITIQLIIVKKKKKQAIIVNVSSSASSCVSAAATDNPQL